MASRPTVKKTTRSSSRSTAGGKTKTQAATKKDKTKPSTGAGAKSGPSAGKKSSAGSKTPARTKKSSGRKKTAGPKKKKTRRSSFFSDHQRPYLLGLGLGLLIGVLGAVFAIYCKEIPEFNSISNKSPEPAVHSLAPPRPAAVPNHKTKTELKRLMHEETRSLEGDIKRLDQALTAALSSWPIDPQNIDFLKTTAKKLGEKKWSHSLIGVRLPPKVTAARMVDYLADHLAKVNLKPSPKLTAHTFEKGLSAKIYFNSLHTHTLRLLPCIPALKPVQNSHGIKRPEYVPAQADRGPKPRVVIIIDDFGLNMDQARCFLNSSLPLTFSILPFLPHSREVARLARQTGRPVMLHLPMQPTQWPEKDAGQGALLMSMNETEIKNRVRAALSAVPGAVGVNNHMGSRFTQDRRRIRWVLEELKDRGLFFLDSVTSTRSVAFEEARRLGMAAGRRTVFLDNIQEPKAIQRQLKKLAARARQDGQAVGIGHVYPITCQTLKYEYNNLKSLIDLIPITDLFQTREKYAGRN